MIKDGEFYKLFEALIYVNDVIPFGAEIQIYYNTKDGNEHTYVGSSKDIREDFEQTIDSFSLLFPKKRSARKRPYRETCFAKRTCIF
jgi:hypothetical protein